ncbi:MAG TPA: malto-oligosyltrehalose synthase [Kofleriaceae bacterium]
MTATYRLQLHGKFTLDDARAILPYLAELGITHVYLSPILQAAPGSTHNYDVVDPEHVSDALGGDPAFDAFAAEAARLGLAILLDIVPNHMSIAGTANRWWLDMLENGPASYYAQFFDVDWASDDHHAARFAGDDRVTLPVLTDRYGRALASGQLAIEHDGRGGFSVRAGELRLPIAPRTVGPIVRRAGEYIGHAELAFIGDALVALPCEIDAETRHRRHRDKGVLGRRLAALCDDRVCAAALDAEISALAIDRAELDAILEQQSYRLVHWSVARDHLSYRRFFDIDTLVGLRQEVLEVFETTHARVIGWLANEKIAGVRVDHVDGLRDPIGYLAHLRERAPEAWIVVEKILRAHEALPPWDADGTTGYEFADRICALLVEPAHEAAMTRAFEDYTGTAWEPRHASRVARLEVMREGLHSEVGRLVDLAVRACAASPACRDFTRGEIASALRELFAGYPAYRTYGPNDQPGSHFAAHDRGRIAAAAREVEGVDRDLLAFLTSALAFEVPAADATELAHVAQQVTGAIVAKGDEDTLAYRQVRLAARCEVGAELDVYAMPPDDVHRLLAAGSPASLLATSTHDSKRSEDVRARIAALSEIPDRWTAAVARWRERADGYWDVAADRTLEYLMWQVIVGAWPIDEKRAAEYMHKASREAKLRTSWRAPDEAFDKAIDTWCRGVFGDRDLMADLAGFAAELAPRGNANALAQLLVKLVAPGVPDIYQGCELADDSLVDPDNRRPVDFVLRARLLRELRDKSVRDLDGLAAAKLWTTARVLGLRRRRPELFLGRYEPFPATGPLADRVFAFKRDEALIAAVNRLGPPAPDTQLVLPAGTWLDALSDRRWRGTVAARELWSALPIALLVIDPS